MATLTELQKIYDQYAEDVRQVRQKASCFAGLFGMGDDPRKHPCHEAFYEAVGHWVEAFVQTGPAPEDVSAAVRYILEAAVLHWEEESCWYMYAAQKHAEALIPMLSRQTCGELRERYEQWYPPIERMPVQTKIYRMLCKGARSK